MPRLLLVAWLFPPHANVGSRRPARIAAHLPALGWDVTVLTQSSVPPRFAELDERATDPRVRVLRAYDPPLLARAVASLDSRAARRRAHTQSRSQGIHSGSSASSSPSPLSFAERWLPTEPAIVWAPHAALRALLERERFDAVLTTSYPFSSHIVGRAIAQARRVPWVADLRDPWTMHFSHERKHRITRAVERALEAQTFAHASAITVTTEALRDAYRLRFASRSSDIHAIRNSFDPIELPPRARPAGPARLVHFGHVYGGARSLAPVLRALAALARERSLTARDVALENYGRFSPEDLALAEQLGLRAMLSVREPVAYEAGMRSMRGAALTLLPAWESEFGPLFLPAKLYDYLYVGAPILAVGRNPELGAILTETRAGALYAPDDATSIRAMIAAALDGALSIEPDPAVVERFSSRAMAERFATVLDALRARGTLARR